MIQATLVKHEEQALEMIKVSAWERLLRVIEFFWLQVQLALNVSAGPKYVRRQRNTVAGPGGSQYTIYTNPSKEGEPPHKRTGFGQRGTIYNLDKTAGWGRVGFLRNAWYMGWHEVNKRSSLLFTLNKCLAQLAAIAGGKAV